MCDREGDHAVKHFPYVVEGHESVLALPHGSELLCQVPSSTETLNWHRTEAHVLKSLLEVRILVCGCIAVERNCMREV